MNIKLPSMDCLIMLKIKNLTVIFILFLIPISAYSHDSIAAPPALHVIGIYEGKTPNGIEEKTSSQRCSDIPKNKVEARSPLQIALVSSSNPCLIEAQKEVSLTITDDTRPIVLALMAYGKTLWKINPEKNVRITKVILAGYHSQSFSGLPRDIPIETYTYDPSPCEKCQKGNIYFHSYVSSPEELKKITGLNTSSFQGAYKGVEFKIFPGMKIERSLSQENNWEIKAIQEIPKYKISTKVVDPKEALDDAIRKGLIRKATQEDVKSWRNAYIQKKYISKNIPVPDKEDALSVSKVDISRTYVVLKKFVYPSGMINENSMIFFIPIGVPDPTGEYGHSAIYDFETLTVECTAARRGSISC